MKALILAAGRGTRMRPLTNVVPKPMIPLVQTPIIETIIKHLAASGVTDIMINTSYMADKLEDYLRDGSQWGVKLAFSFEGGMENGVLIDEPVGSAGAIRKIQDFSGFFDEPFLVLCGDGYTDFNIEQLAKFHNDNGAIASLLTQQVDPSEVSSYGVVASNDQGKITGFQEKPEVAEAISNNINTGIYLFDPEVIQHIPQNREYDIGGELFPDLLSKNLPFCAQAQEFTWLDMGRLTDFLPCQAATLAGECANFDMTAEQVKPGLWIGHNTRIDLDKVNIQGPAYIGSSCHIEDGATIIGPSYIGPGCHIQNGAVVEGAYLDRHRRIESGVSIKELTVFGDYIIYADGEHKLLVLSDSKVVDARSIQQAPEQQKKQA